MAGCERAITEEEIREALKLVGRDKIPGGLPYGVFLGTVSPICSSAGTDVQPLFEEWEHAPMLYQRCHQVAT